MRDEVRGALPDRLRHEVEVTVEGGLVPPSTGQPRVGRQPDGRSVKQRGDRPRRGGRGEVDLASRACHPGEVEVEVVDARHDRRVAGIDDAAPRRGAGHDVAALPDRDHAALGDADRLGDDQAVRREGDDDLAAQHQVGTRRRHRSMRGVLRKCRVRGRKAILPSAAGTTSSQCERNNDPRRLRTSNGQPATPCAESPAAASRNVPSP